ncbi:hypothetical protein BH10PSE17_BH10PSE17_00750 [soil metagenome]
MDDDKPSSFADQWLTAMMLIGVNGDDARRFFYEVLYVAGDGAVKRITIRADRSKAHKEYITSHAQWVDEFIGDLKAGWFGDGTEADTGPQRR